MWLCTTLVKFRDGWRLFEFWKQIGDLQTFAERMRVGADFQGVLTLAHVYAIPPEQLGFDVGPAVLPPLAQQVEQPPDEIEVEAEERGVPVDIEIGEASPEDRVVEAPVEHDAALWRVSHSHLAAVWPTFALDVKAWDYQSAVVKRNAGS